jgi:hypothetical protein
MKVRNSGERIRKYGAGKGETSISNEGFQFHRMHFVDMRQLLHDRHTFELYERYNMVPMIAIEQSNDGSNALLVYADYYSFRYKSSLAFSHFLFAKKIIHSDSSLQSMKVHKDLAVVPDVLEDTIESVRDNFTLLYKVTSYMSKNYFSNNEVAIFTSLFENAFDLDSPEKECDNLCEQLFGNKEIIAQDAFTMMKRISLVQSKLDRNCPVPGVTPDMPKISVKMIEKDWRIAYTSQGRKKTLYAGYKGNKNPFEERVYHIVLTIILNRILPMDKGLVIESLQEYGCSPIDINNAIDTWQHAEKNSDKDISTFLHLLEIIEYMYADKSSFVRRNRLVKSIFTYHLCECPISGQHIY